MMKGLKGNMIFIGLSDENLERLKKDQPIKFNLQDIGLPDYDVFIFNGKDEQTMFEMVKDAIDPLKTILKSDNAKNN